MRSLSRRAFGSSLLAAAVAGCRRRSREARDPAGGGRVPIEIDVSTSLGAFDRLSGVQGSPAPILAGEPEHVDGFIRAGIARARFPQDCPPNTLTLSGIFPDERADPDSTSSYHFEAIDRHVRAARAAGAEILWQSSYDVGRSDAWVGPNLGGRAPEDLERWSRVVTRCLEHFNNGFASGFEHAVRNVEFVNEPDGLGGFRGRHAKRLLPAFIRFLDTVELYNRAHPGTPVRAVGPGIPLSLAEWPRWRPRFATALRELAASGKVLPVFSFHTYGRDVSPRANGELARELRALLDAHGFQRTELWNTEWLAGDFLREHLGVDTGRAARAGEAEQRRYASAMAAYALACKLRWQGLLTGSFYYRANRRAFPADHEPRLGGVGLGFTQFFAASGRLQALALGERLLADVVERTPERCPTQLADDGLLTVAALRSADGKRASLLIASLATEPRRLSVTLRGLERAEAEGVLLDGRADLAPHRLAAPIPRGGALALELDVAPLSSAWVVLG